MVRIHFWSLGNMEYPFFTATPKSTLTQNGSSCLGPIYEPVIYQG